MQTKIRTRLANPPSSVLPNDPAKASLYLAWKRALAERDDLLRQARHRKHELLRDLKARHETQVILLEMERRSQVEKLKQAVATEKEKAEAYKKDLVALDESIDSARSAMAKFRQEFEQLRVQLLLDKMTKSTQVCLPVAVCFSAPPTYAGVNCYYWWPMQAANLADRRRRLAHEAEQFREAVEAAKQRIAADEAAKWESRLAAEREAGERRLAEERQAIEAKIEKVRAALAERYEAGFKPLLLEAEARHVEELNKLVSLQKQLEAKEQELHAAQESAKAISAVIGTETKDGTSSVCSQPHMQSTVDKPLCLQMRMCLSGSCVSLKN